MNFFQTYRKASGAIVLLIMLSFFWTNMIAFYPQVQDHLPISSSWHHVMDLELELEDQEKEENLFRKIRGEFTLSDLRDVKNQILFLHKNSFQILHHPEIFTPPPEHCSLSDRV